MATPHTDCPIVEPHLPHGMATWGHPGQYCPGADPQLLLALPWRTGMHVGRTLYAVLGSEPSKDDPLIGVMDTRELAALVVLHHNTSLGHHTGP